jgi:hypothetical protein
VMAPITRQVANLPLKQSRVHYGRL